MRTAALYEMLFGLLTLIGGIIGFAVSGSVVSLASGVAAGLVLVFAGLQMQKGKRRGLMIALTVTLLLLGYFGYTLFFAAAAFFPSGVMAALSAISLLVLGIVMVQPKKRERVF